MIWKRGLLTLVALGGLLVSFEEARAQAAGKSDEIEAAFRRCHVWRVVADLKKGDRVWIFPYWIADPNDQLNPEAKRQGMGWIPIGDGGVEEKRGEYEARIPQIVGLWSSTRFPKAEFDFVTPLGVTLSFTPERSKGSVELYRGRFIEFRPRRVAASVPDFYSIECRIGESNEYLEPVNDFDVGSKAGQRLPGLGSDRLTEYLGPSVMEPVPPVPPESVPGALPMGRLFSKENNGLATSPGSGIAKPFNPGSDVAVAPSPKIGELGLDSKSSEIPRQRDALAPATKSPVVPGKAPPPDIVCDVTTKGPVETPKDTKLVSPQTVGLRNVSRSVNGFDYIASGDAVPTGKEIDVSGSVDMLVPYEPVRVRGASGSSTLYVSISGIGETRNRVVENSAPRPSKNLRILVVGGAAELALSGFELIDGYLNASGSDRIGLEIEWQLVDQSGSMRPVGRYNSFDALVKAAAGKGDARPDVLDEGQLLELFDEFESAMRSRKVDKVFWVKGAYSVPSTIPQRLEKFLDNVGASDAIPHTPTGEPSKWLQIVTARMPGFSIAYLKEPVNSRRSGEVLEEVAGAVTGPRRLISAEDANVLASKLRTTLALAATTPRPSSDALPDRGGLSGKLVLDAGEVFRERGYVLSIDSARDLQDYLKSVQKLWSPSGAMISGVLEDFATRTGRPQPSLLDVLQLDDSRKYPRLPKILPDWSLKSLKGLNPAEAENARTFVSTYAESVTRRIEEMKLGSPVSRCTLFYMSEVGLGFK